MDMFEKKEANLLPEKGEVYYYPSFFNSPQSDDFFGKLVNEIQWKQEPIWMFGKKVMQPRLTALYGNPSVPYGYSGIKMQPFPWTDFLSQIKEAIEQVADTDFTHVLLNYYRDGKDSMGWHRDNEAELGKNPIIGSVSFGYPRRFQFRLYEEKCKKKEVLLEHGSFLLMSGATQHYWEHQIPKSQKVQGARINLTFRKILK
jgi:alkylated DNA repair dioxygenase AlkB